MKIYRDVNIENTDLSLALGFFDGVHRGHYSVIKNAVNFARESGLKSAVVTFENHPKYFFSKSVPEYILTKHAKLKIFENLGVDFVYFIHFEEKFSNITAREYLDLLSSKLNPKAIFTGFNHYFGKNREGDCEFLSENQKKYGYKYFRLSPVKIGDEIISSSLIRENIKIGNIEKVNKMLGYNYFLEETVVKGEQIGRKLGFRTANLIYPSGILNICRGVYCVDIDFENKKYYGVANFGMRPSFENTKIPVLEVHILNFNENIYGKVLKVNFIKKIRDEKKFSSVDELKEQIAHDVNLVKREML